jgi:hypothetical protein
LADLPVGLDPAALNDEDLLSAIRFPAQVRS